MAERSRYHVSNQAAGISDGILRNRLGIKDQEQLDQAETLLLADTYTYFFSPLNQSKVKFDLALLFAIHKYFLGTLYEWAGKVRSVNISKNGMVFAATKYLDVVLQDFNTLVTNLLSQNFANKQTLVQTLAIIHNEFNAIHPFREGNGRTLRLFLDLIAVKYGYDPIDWGKISDKQYFNACIQGAKGNNQAMVRIIKLCLHKPKHNA